MPPSPRTKAADVNVEPQIADAFNGVLRQLGSKQSKVGYEKDWVAFRQWLARKNVNVLDVEADHIETYVAEMHEEGKAKATRGRALSVLRAVYGRFVVKKLVSSNPAREVKNMKVGGTSRTPWLKADQIEKLLCWRGGETWLDRRDRLCVHLLAGLGRRRSEIARVAVEDFRDGDNFSIVKGGKQKWAKIPTWLATEIEAWKAFSEVSSGPLLPRSETNRKAISGDIVYNIAIRVGEAAGLPKDACAPHALRRSLATLAEERGVPLKDIQLTLGHESIVTTEKYLKGSRTVAEAPGEWMGKLVK